MTRRNFLLFIVVLFLVAGLLPVISMLVKSIIADGVFSLESYEGLLSSKRQWMLMGHSFLLSTLVTTLSMAVGVPLGILFEKTDLPFRRLFILLFVIPLLIPPYIIAVSWFYLLGGDGILAHAGGTGLLISGIVSRLLFGLPGCTFVLFSIYLSIPMLLTMIFLRTVNPRLEEAARLVSGVRGVMKGITLPLVMPGLLLSAMLVFLLSFGEFSVPNFLRYDVFPVESFTQFSAFYDFRAATAASVPLVGVTLILLLAEAAFLRERTYQLNPTPEDEMLPPIRLKKKRNLILILVSMICFVVVIVPFIALLTRAGGPDTYVEAIGRARGSLLRSLLYASAGATILTFFGFFIGYSIETGALSLRWSLDSVTVFLFALPGTVIGIGLISLWNTPWTNFIYSTPLIVIVGYLAKYTALTSRITVAQLGRIPQSMEEAARVAGAGWFRRMIFIMIPMARRGLIAGWLVGYIFSLRDTGITMLVYPAGHETLPVRIFTLMANGAPELIAALCMIMVTATLLPVGFAWFIPGLVRGRGT